MTEKSTGMKYRHEYKYVCNSMQSIVLKTRASGIMKRDIHAGANGYYRIRSLYFDDMEDTCYYENESGVGERDKYRIRIYNGDISRISLEKKSKNRGMTLKTACRINEEICRKLMKGEKNIIDSNMTYVQKKLLLEMQLKNMSPKVIVEYVRYPFVNQNGNVRVTFDEAISSSNDIGCFLEKEIVLRPILEKGQGILEVKWDEFLPDYIKKIMELDSLRWNSFSKYYLCRKYNTFGGVRI